MPLPLFPPPDCRPWPIDGVLDGLVVGQALGSGVCIRVCTGATHAADAVTLELPITRVALVVLRKKDVRGKW